MPQYRFSGVAVSVNNALNANRVLYFVDARQSFAISNKFSPCLAKPAL